MRAFVNDVLSDAGPAGPARPTDVALEFKHVCRSAQGLGAVGYSASSSSAAHYLQQAAHLQLDCAAAAVLTTGTSWMQLGDPMTG